MNKLYVGLLQHSFVQIGDFGRAATQSALQQWWAALIVW